MSTELLPAPKDAAGEIRRHEFGATQSTPQLETAVAAIQAREQAAVQARFIMAERHPRDIEGFRVALLKECERAGFAKDAEYPAKLIPSGGDRSKHRPTIRFIEGALRCYRNVFKEAVTTFDSVELRISRVTVTDLQNNIVYSSEARTSKQVERHGRPNRNTGNMEPPEGRQVIGERTTSEGKQIYIVRATDAEILGKHNGLESRAMRNEGRRLLPADIVDEAIEKARETMRQEDIKDPDKAKRTIIDSFDGVGVRPEDLRDYLGHDLERFQPKELQDLRGIFSAMRDGDTTWDAIMSAKAPTGSQEAQQETAKAVLDKLRKTGEKPGEAKPAANKRKKKTKSPDTSEAKGSTGNSGAEYAAAQGGGQAASSATPPPEVPEVDELPDPAKAAKGEIIRYQGEEWVVNPDTSAWRRLKSKPQPTESSRLVFGGKK